MEPGKDNNDYIAQLRQRVNAHVAVTPLPSHLQRRFSLLRSDQTAPEEPAQKKIDFSHLAEDPELQQHVAYLMHYTPSKWLLEQEAELVADRRDLHHPGQKMPRFRQTDPNEDIYDWARTHRLSAQSRRSNAKMHSIRRSST